MGSKFLHTHVRTPEARAVVKALRKLAKARGFTEPAEGEPCDQDVVVARDKASPGWTSIYRRFDDVAAELSGLLETDVLVTSIFDSDVLEADLFREGAEIDRFSSDRDEKGRRGQPRRWDSTCVEGRSWRDIQAVFKRATSDAEGALVELGRIIGLDVRSLYPDHLEPTDPKVHRLRFRNPPAARRRVVEGAPAIDPASPGEPLHVKRGINARLNLLARSAGGGSNGIAIALGGDAIRRGLVTVPSVTFRGASAPTLERQEPDGAWMIAELPNVGLPAASGLVNEHDEVVSTDNHPPVQLALVVEAGHPGEGVLLVRWTPLDPLGPTITQHFAVRVA